MRYVLIPITDDLPMRLSDLSLALEYGVAAAAGRPALPHDNEVFSVSLLEAAGYEIEERDE